MQITCPDCRQSFERVQSKVRESIKRSGVWRCLGCSVAARNKAQAPALGAERSLKSGYVEIYTESGWMRRNRYVMEQSLGRKLTGDEYVRHANGIHSDDRLDNLELVSRLVCISRKGEKRTGKALENIRASQPNKRGVRLNPAYAAAIRLRIKAGHSQRSVARYFRVAPMTINKIVHGQTWRRA